MRKTLKFYIPGGFAHGSQNLNSNTKFIVFSNFDIKQSLKDDYRFESDYWEVGILNIVKIKYEKYSVPKKSNTIKYTLKKLNGAFGKLGCVIDSNKFLLGVVTEGDLRRAILNGISINNKLEKVINVKPTFVYKHELISKISESNFNATNLNASIFYVPIVNKKRKVLDVLSIENLIDILENKASKKERVC